MMHYAGSLMEDDGFIYFLPVCDTQDELLDYFSKETKESGENKYFLDSLVKIIRVGLEEFGTLDRLVDEIDKHGYDAEYPEKLNRCHEEIGLDNSFMMITPEFTLGFVFELFREYCLREGIYREELINCLVDDLVPCNLERQGFSTDDTEYGKYSYIKWMDVIDFYYKDEMYEGFKQITLKETGDNTLDPKVYIIEKILKLAEEYDIAE